MKHSQSFESYTIAEANFRGQVNAYHSLLRNDRRRIRDFHSVDIPVPEPPKAILVFDFADHPEAMPERFAYWEINKKLIVVVLRGTPVETLTVSHNEIRYGCIFVKTDTGRRFMMLEKTTYQFHHVLEEVAPEGGTAGGV